jgi:hypothetical protein
VDRRLAGDLPTTEHIGGDALRFGARHRGDGAHSSLVANLGVALEQLTGEHDLVTKGGSLEALLGGERLDGEGRLLVLVAG